MNQEIKQIVERRDALYNQIQETESALTELNRRYTALTQALNEANLKVLSSAIAQKEPA